MEALAEKRRELEALFGKYQGTYATDYIHHHELPKEFKKYVASDKVNRSTGDILRVAQNIATVNRDLEPFTEDHVRRSFYLGVNDVAPPASPPRHASQIPSRETRVFTSPYAALPLKSPGMGAAAKGTKRGRPFAKEPAGLTEELMTISGVWMYSGQPGQGRTVSMMTQYEVVEMAREIFKLLKKERCKEYGGNPFDVDIQPHSCAELGVPNYFEVVKEPPMNLVIVLESATMRLMSWQKKINKREYLALKEFVSDIRLMFRNAFTFNIKGDPIWRFAEKLQGTFNHQLKTKLTAVNVSDDEGVLGGDA